MCRQSKPSAPPSCTTTALFHFGALHSELVQNGPRIGIGCPFYQWLEPRLFHPGRWAVIPDMPGAPSQMNDGLLNDWPFGQKGAPLWHMDGPLDRLLRLCERYDRVCLGWTGPKVDSPDYHRRMDEVAKALGNRWPVLHMMRGTAVAFDYPFTSADSTSLAQNGWKYDAGFDFGDAWRGRKTYANRLENGCGRGSFSPAPQQGNGNSPPAFVAHNRLDRQASGCRDAEKTTRQLGFTF
jgi:hypothetical protein